MKRHFLSDQHRRHRSAWCLALQHWQHGARSICPTRVDSCCTSPMGVCGCRGTETLHIHRESSDTLFRMVEALSWYGEPFPMTIQVTVHGNLNGDGCIHNILKLVVLHFDNHVFVTQPVFMDDNARSHRSRAVTAFLYLWMTTPDCSRDVTAFLYLWMTTPGTIVLVP